jgi:hypothetical protein
MESRPRRTTLEIFNDEMAVMDRPLETDVEYFDDEKPPSRLRGRASIVLGIVAIGAACGLFFVKVRSPASAAATAATPAAPPVATAVAAASPIAAPTPPAAELPAPEAAAAEEPAGDPAAASASAWRAPPRAAWSKIRTSKAGHPKHAKATGGKVTYRRTTTTTTKRTVVMRHTVSGRR